MPTTRGYKKGVGRSAHPHHLDNHYSTARLEVKIFEAIARNTCYTPDQVAKLIPDEPPGRVKGHLKWLMRRAWVVNFPYELGEGSSSEAYPRPR